MPSTMIHFLVAHKVEPSALNLFWVGNFAPDCVNDRVSKDKIHLRENNNRWNLLKKLFYDIDINNSFERGWFLHLFVDACWDENELSEYRKWYEEKNQDGDWFYNYREEIGKASYYLYHNLSWAKTIFELIDRTQMSDIKTSLPISLSECQQYKDRIITKHAQSDAMQMPSYFTINKLHVFASATAKKYQKWINSHKKIL